MDKPTTVISVHRSDPKWADRYTIVTNIPDGNGNAAVMTLNLSDDCDMPNGFSQWGNLSPSEEITAPVIQWEELPEHVQRHAAERIKEDD